ncbi:MAG: 2-dehydropantoate 2-reductase N-terminal domain-containing protein, partial [Nitrosomonadales bacterium]|nr:2-dehydropantoate 2-reductase N-terminal domain-containing protein [Nitrosomonadales bacterium]
MKKIAVLGAGAWGTALAIQLSQRHQIALWMRSAERAAEMREAGCNNQYLGDFLFNQNLQVEHDLSVALADADLIIS